MVNGENRAKFKNWWHRKPSTPKSSVSTPPVSKQSSEKEKSSLASNYNEEYSNILADMTILNIQQRIESKESDHESGSFNIRDGEEVPSKFDPKNTRIVMKKEESSPTETRGRSRNRVEYNTKQFTQPYSSTALSQVGLLKKKLDTENFYPQNTRRSSSRHNHHSLDIKSPNQVQYTTPLILKINGLECPTHNSPGPMFNSQLEGRRDCSIKKDAIANQKCVSGNHENKTINSLRETKQPGEFFDLTEDRYYKEFVAMMREQVQSKRELGKHKRKRTLEYSERDINTSLSDEESDNPTETTPNLEIYDSVYQRYGDYNSYNEELERNVDFDWDVDLREIQDKCPPRASHAQRQRSSLD